MPFYTLDSWYGAGFAYQSRLPWALRGACTYLVLWVAKRNGSCHALDVSCLVGAQASTGGIPG